MLKHQWLMLVVFEWNKFRETENIAYGFYVYHWGHTSIVNRRYKTINTSTWYYDSGVLKCWIYYGNARAQENWQSRPSFGPDFNSPAQRVDLVVRIDLSFLSRVPVGVPQVCIPILLFFIFFILCSISLHFDCVLFGRVWWFLCIVSMLKMVFWYSKNGEAQQYCTQRPLPQGMG